MSKTALTVLCVAGYFLVGMITLFLLARHEYKNESDNNLNAPDIIGISMFWPIVISYFILVLPVILYFGIIHLAELSVDKRNKKKLDEYEDDEQYNSDWS